MADIDDRWHRGADRVPTARYGKGSRWLARWRDENGTQRSKAFARKIDAERHLAKVATDLARGTYLDSTAGRVTLEAYAAVWLHNQTFDPATREAVARRLRNVINPHLGDYEIRAIKPSRIQSWLRTLQQQQRATQAIRIAYGNLHTILDAAVDDKLIAVNPCQARSIRLPRAERKLLHPWSEDRLTAVLEALRGRERAAIITAAGLGLRQGEVLGLAVEDVDWLRSEVHINRQLKYIGNRLVFGPPKGGKPRTVPLPESVKRTLADHVRAYPSGEVTLPWLPPGKPDTMTAGLLFTNDGVAWRGAVFNLRVWRPALKAAGVPNEREHGMHALRHFYASTLLEDGVSIRVLADYLGHTDPGFTLRVYAHLMPSSAGKARAAVDRALSSCVPNVYQHSTDTPSYAGQTPS